MTYYNGSKFVWQNGRELASLTTSSGTSVTYTYDSDGIRMSKKVGSVTTNYTLEGSNVIYETNGTDNLWYYYDTGGNPVSFELNGISYHYVKNLQGDIIAIVNDSGAKVVEYKYDSWGKLISTTGSLASTVGVKNPYRYRGYRYDNETGLYYLQSRYYDPKIGRFINADSVDYLDASGTVLACNLFAFCENNPVNYVDPNGNVAAIIILGLSFTLGEIIGICVALGLIYLSIRWAINPGECRAFIDSVSSEATRIKANISKSSQNNKKSKSKAKKKTSKKSGKEKASDAPSWAKKQTPKIGERAETFTKRIMNEKYGKNQYEKGPSTEYNKILKWAHRSLGLK